MKRIEKSNPPPGTRGKNVYQNQVPSFHQKINSPGCRITLVAAISGTKKMWPASAGIMALGIITVLLSKETAFLTFITPLVAAASLAAIYGPQNDPASELTMAAPISPWKILLARLTLVSGYNLLLALVSSVVLLAVIPVGLLGTLSSLGLDH
jgi:ABC-type transport system involved in multi-copper enzyme maturation permease subunit